MTNTRLTITDIELATLDSEDYKWTRLSDFYLTRIIQKANELGLQGKKIEEIIGVQETFGTMSKYIDFITN